MIEGSKPRFHVLALYSYLARNVVAHASRDGCAAGKNRYVLIISVLLERWSEEFCPCFSVRWLQNSLGFKCRKRTLF